MGIFFITILRYSLNNKRLGRLIQEMNPEENRFYQNSLSSGNPGVPSQETLLPPLFKNNHSRPDLPDRFIDSP
jgi:hypothetical protein